jgi:ATP-dependent RNA helicase DDX19/DBP5
MEETTPVVSETPEVEAAESEPKASAEPEGKKEEAVETFQPRQQAALREVTGRVVVTGSTEHVSASTWDDLNLPQPLMNAIYEMGFHRPSKIQEVALPILARGRNLIGQAHNGTGKTAAYSIGCLAQINPAERVPQVLILAHTRELAQQVAGVVGDLGKYLGVVITTLVPKQEWSGTPGHVLVGTPGKTLEYCKKRWVKVDKVKCMVLDEADVMLNQDNQMGPQVNMVRRFLPQDLQTILFSATFPDQVRAFASQIIQKAAKIVVRKEELTVSNVHQLYEESGDFEDKYKKLSDLYTFLTMIGQSIIFVNSRDTAFKLAKRLKEVDGHSVSLICGSRQGVGNDASQMDAKERDRVMEEFRNGVTKVLVATDVLSRGIDVPAVTMVVNFDIPLMFSVGSNRHTGEANMEEYLHRVGRTGRFGQPGIAINLVSRPERDLIRSIEEYFQCEIKPVPDYEELAYQVKQLRPSQGGELTQGEL